MTLKYLTVLVNSEHPDRRSDAELKTWRTLDEACEYLRGLRKKIGTSGPGHRSPKIAVARASPTGTRSLRSSRAVESLDRDQGLRTAKQANESSFTGDQLSAKL